MRLLYIKAFMLGESSRSTKTCAKLQRNMASSSPRFPAGFIRQKRSPTSPRWATSSCWTEPKIPAGMPLSITFSQEKAKRDAYHTRWRCRHRYSGVTAKLSSPKVDGIRYPQLDANHVQMLY